MLMKKLKQITAWMLILGMSLYPITAHATVNGDNGGTGSANIGSSSDYKRWSNQHNFYRFYLINANLERVTPVYDFYYTEPCGVTDVMTSTRFDGASSPSSWNSYSISELARLTGSTVSEIPKAVANGEGHGVQFREWFLDGIPYTGGDSGIPIISSGGSSSNFGGNSNSSNSSSSSSSNSGSSIISGDISTYPENVKSNIQQGQIIDKIDLSKERDNLSNLEVSDALYYIGSAKTIYITYSYAAPNYLTSEQKKQYALSKAYTALSCTNLSYHQKIYLIALVGKEVATNSSSTTGSVYIEDLLSQNIPLSDGLCAAEKFLKDSNGIHVDGYESAFVSMVEAGYMLCVEAGTWLYVPTGNIYPPEGQKTYGTYWNLCSKWVAQGGPEKGGFYGNILTALYNSCMVVNSDVTTENGAVLLAGKTGYRTMSQSLIDMNCSGTSLHIYSSLDLTPTVPEPERIEISGDWVLNESEISKPVTTSTKTSNQIMKYSLGSLEKCDTDHLDCQHSCNDDCEGGDLDCDSKDPKHVHNDSCYTKEYCGHSHNSSCYKKCDSYSLHDKGLSFTLRNTKENDFPSLLASSLGTRNNTISKDRTKTEAETVEASGFTYDFLIFRGADKLNFASYVNNINILGFSSLNSKSAVTRKTADYQESISINLTDASSDLDTSANGNRHGDGLFTDTASPLTTIGYTGTVAIKTYSGKQRAINTTVNDNPLMRLTNVSNDNTAGRQVDSKAQIIFNPYIKMTYAGLDNVKHEVNVLGEYQRTICPDDYAEIQWTYEPENLKVQSQMWALDRMYTDKNDGLDWTDTNQVLKGGSTYSLVTDKKVVSLNTYQTLVGDSSRAISSISGDYNLSEAEAMEAHNIFVQGALAKFDSTEVIQYVSTDLNDKNAWEDGIAVYAGANIRDLDNGSTTASEESKYYLRSDVNNVTNISRNDLDVRELGTTKKFYRFYSDTNGRIFMVEGDSISAVESSAGSQILDKTQGVSSLFGTAQFLDNRTLVVTKLLAALERNTGNDTTASWAPDGKWYNEAYSGIIIMVQRTGVEIKFDKTNARTTVLDPKLVPNINSKYTQVKKESLTAFMSQYCTNLSENEPISTFKGQQVFMYKPNELFNSNKFYIPPMTVQD